VSAALSDEERAFVAEVERINLRFTVEVVEGFDVCPYARGARGDGTAVREVMLQRDADPAPTLALIDRLEADRRNLDVVQVIYPLLDVTPRQFEHFNAAIRQADAARRKQRAVFVHATFHPDYGLDTRSPDALVSFLRRSPDPMIQLVRYSTIEDVRGPSPRKLVVDLASFDLRDLDKLKVRNVSQRITDDNYARVMREGTDRIERAYKDIREDRDRSYARFAALGVRARG
jgi:hypothetical protein